MEKSALPSKIQVIRRAAQILRSCRDAGVGCSLGTIAVDVGLPRSTVQRIVAALIAEGFLRSDGSAGSVMLGPEIFSLGGSSDLDVAHIAGPHLMRLAQVTGETVDLAKVNRDHLIFISQIAGAHRLRAVSAVGEKFPFHCSANGKAALSLMTEREFQAACPARLEKMTPATITSRKRLHAEIAQIKKNGMAFDRQEHSEGISAIGVAFRTATQAIHAISIPMPTIRFAENVDQFCVELETTKQRVLEALSLV